MTFSRLAPRPFAGELRLVAAAMLPAMTSLMFTNWIDRAFMDAAFVVGALAVFGILRVWRRLETAPTQ